MKSEKAGLFKVCNGNYGGPATGITVKKVETKIFSVAAIVYISIQTTFSVMKLIKQLDLFPTQVDVTRDLAQHNFLVFAHFNMGVIETRIFISMLARINREDTDFKNIRIPVSEILPNDDGRSYRWLKEACRNLTGFKVNLRHFEKDSFHYIVLVNETAYQNGSGYIHASFSDKAKPYLLQLAGNFTTAQHFRLLQLKSPNSTRFYWILKSLYKTDRITLEVDKIKAILFGEQFNDQGGKDKYEKYYMFKKRVIIPVQQELEGTECAFTFVENKEKLAVVSITFILNQVQISESAQENPLYQRLIELGISVKSIPDIDILVQNSIITNEYIEYVIKTVMRNAKITKKAGSIFKAIVEKHLWEEFMASSKKTIYHSPASPAQSVEEAKRVISHQQAEKQYEQYLASGQTKYKTLSAYIYGLKMQNIIVEG